MSALLLKDKIEVETTHGLCEIHLTFGSITKLEKKDKVDVLVVSAFPGDYSPTPTSVIGALQRDLKISVRKLSQDKEEDHRRLFSCWWSKPLPKEHSYGRILCFEGSFKRQSRPPMVVGEVFRCLVSICKEKEIKVMMPLLAAGDQGYSQEMMLRLIVEAAIHWMQIGLPLKVLKIVIYSRDLNKVESDPLLAYFRKLKAKWADTFKKEHEKPEVHPINYDVYLSYNNQDKKLAEIVIEKLKEMSQNIRIYSKHQNLNSNASWQEEIYQVMVASARVITILSPRFLADEACLEQYNIALCCTRNMKRDYLAPFYIDSIDDMPTYMCLIQYVDCRPSDYQKISEACSHVTSWLSLHLAEIQHLESKSSTVTVAKPPKNQEYDVFISYSHQNSDVAGIIKNHLALFHPDWNIFIDIAELQTGVAWQAKLYNSIESSRYVITLVSPPYLQSKVCQEEYNLASALHADPAYQTRLIPVLVEPVERLPAWCRNYEPIDCRDLSDRAMMEILGKIDLFENVSHLENPSVAAMEDITSDWRTEHLHSGFSFFENISFKDIMQFSPTSLNDPGDTNNTDILLSFHEADAAEGGFFVKRLQYYLPGVSISCPESSKVRHSLLDEASLIVALLSGPFVKSAELSEELATALCRQRFSNRLVLFPVSLESLPLSPAYFRLLWSVVGCTDRIWQNPFVPEIDDDSELLPSASQRCLDFSARMISFILKNPSLFQGSYKTILSTEELLESTLRFRAKRPFDLTDYNPLYFDHNRAGHTVSEMEPARKDFCHVNSMEDMKEKLKNSDLKKEKFASISPQQDSSPAKFSMCTSENDDKSTERRRLLPKQPSENDDGMSAPVSSITEHVDMGEKFSNVGLEDKPRIPMQEKNPKRKETETKVDDGVKEPCKEES